MVEKRLTGFTSMNGVELGFDTVAARQGMRHGILDVGVCSAAKSVVGRIEEQHLTEKQDY